MDRSKVLVCSAWPYASGVPHLGNLVGSLLSGDVFMRYYRMRGADVLYVSGTDAHGTRIEFEAEQEGITPAELADRNHRRIVDILQGFGIAFDNYTTTENETHKAFVRDIYLDMEKNGFICTKVEKRAFCSTCEQFLADRLITGTCPKCGSPDALGNQCDACGAMLEPEQLVEPHCTRCGKSEIEFRETKHWYLDLAKLSKPLEAYVASRDFQGNVAQYTQRMIDDGLQPRAMTRDIEWGIPAPFAGAEGKVIYVWGEAALGYVSAVIEHFGGDKRWEEFWFDEDVFQIYAVGKDNISFHTLIFPGQLIASNRGYHLPDQIAATEFLNWIGGRSFSKSRNVGVFCDDALELMDGELWRFYLLYNRPEGRDVNFSWEELEKAINGILISNVANLVNRVLSFVQSNYGCIVPNVAVEKEVTARIEAVTGAYERAVENGLLGQALRTACDLAVFGNEYFQRKAPWANDDREAVTSAVALVKALALMLAPYIPSFAGQVLEVLGISDATWANLEGDVAGESLTMDRVLLERIEIDEIRERVEAGVARDVETVEDYASFEDFQKLDLRVGVIREASEVAGADRLVRLSIDLGSETRNCVAGIKTAYALDDLVGHSVVVVANLAPREIRGLRSECMLLAAKDEELALIEPDRSMKPGTPVA